MIDEPDFCSPIADHLFCYLVADKANKVAFCSQRLLQCLPHGLSITGVSFEKLIKLLNSSQTESSFSSEQWWAIPYNSDQTIYILCAPHFNFKHTSELQKSVIQFFSQLPYGIMQLNTQLECEYINTTLLQLAGVERSQIENKHWLNMLYYKDVEKVEAKLDALVKASPIGQPLTIECRIQKPLGEVRWIQLSCVLNNNLLTSHNPDAQSRELSKLIIIVNDLGINKLTHWQSQTKGQDALTGLYNRQGFHEKLTELLQVTQKLSRPIVIYHLDLDGFKIINDELGHAAGDELLCQVATCLKNKFANNCIIARIGGDEFLIASNEVHHQSDAQKLGKAIIQTVNGYYEVSNQAVHSSCSIGASQQLLSSKNSYTLDDIAKNVLRRCEKAVEKAKAKGKNQLVFHEDNSHRHNKNTFVILNDISWGIREKQFYMAYQPIISTTTNKVQLIEALIRWRHPYLGNVSPGSFIPLAESSGSIVPLSDWILERVFYEFDNLLKAEPCQPLQMTINLSAFQLADDLFLEKIQNLISEVSFSSENIIFETTETVFMDDMARNAQVLKELRRSGFKIALDDFGTGYSSLSYLNRLSYDILKIDHSFVRNLAESDRTQALLKNIINMAHDLGMSVIAEGIETEQQKSYLNDKCEYLQGFLFHRPMPYSELATVITENTIDSISTSSGK